MKTRVLYISYDGMLEPLGQSQVLSYQEHLANSAELHLLSFEKAEDWSDESARNALARRIHKAGIHWHPRRYHKRPSALATAYDIMAGIVTGLWIVLRHRIDVVHARSYVAGVIALALKKLTGARFVFDMRGFWADERVDGGLWPRGGRMFRIAKWFERQFLTNADHVISLTHAAVREMMKFPYLADRMPPVSVIPTCADLDRFVPLSNERLVDSFVLGYVGTVSTWYLFDETVSGFAELLRLKPSAQILIVNRGEHALIRERMAAGGIPEAAVEIRSATHAEIPHLMARMDASIFFIKPVFSKQASAPTKLGELLGCGIPCLSNRGVGDMAEILESERAGVAISEFDDLSIKAGLEKLIQLANNPDTKARCVTAAKKYFALRTGVTQYQEIYGKLTTYDR